MGINCPKCHFENPDDTIYCGKCATQLKSSEEISASLTETLETPKEEITTGSTFAGRYQIIEELGKGGMGKVYRVVDRKLDEEVALKLIKPEIASDRKTVERFSKELKFARKIVHKNVGRMYELMEHEGKYFITMEYVPGQDLKRLIRQTGQLTVGKSISIAKQVCEGLAEAHKLRVVHRDLKPHNIMIDKEGNARIMDFGIARSLDAEGITDAKVVIGTPKYMSPEQVEGEVVDQRSDLYSLGIVLYEMVTERTPFEGDTALSIALKHKTQAPPEPREFNAQIPEDLSLVILKCLEKDKQKRYQRAEEVLSELRSIEKNFPTGERIILEKKLEAETKKKRFQSFFVPGIVLFAAAILVAGYFFFGQFLKTGRIGSEVIDEMEWKESIAVLPFEDGSESKDQGPLCEQMTIDIIGKLSQIEGLSVKPYKTVESDKYRNISNKEIGKELGVTRILESYLKMEDNRIQVYSHIIDAKKDSIIKSFEYDKDFDDIFTVQDNLTKEIAKTLGLSMVGEIFKEYKKIEPKDTEAYSYYVSGRNFGKKYAISKEENDFASAKRMYEEALNVDPNYAKAYWGLGNIYETKYNINPEDQDMEDIQSAMDNFWKSYQINPNLAESHSGLGWAFFYKADNDNAFDFFKSGLEIEPNNSEINYNAGAFFLSIGLYPQAIKFCSKAVELDPLNFWAHHMRAYCSMYVGDYDKAAGYFQSALNIDPNNLELLSRYVFFFILTKNIEEAEKVLEKAEKIDEQDHLRIRHARGLLLAIKGEKEEALQLIQDRLFSYFATSIYSLLGMKDEAVKNIQVGIEEGFKYLNIYLYSYPFLENNPCYDNLQDDSRFQDIIKEEKMKYQEKRFKYGKL